MNVRSPAAVRLAVAACAAMLLAFAGVATQAQAPAPAWPEAGKGFGEHPLATQCELTAEGPRLLVKGEFDGGSGARFNAAFDRCIDRGDGRTIQVWFWSPGGSVNDGIEVGRRLSDAGDRVTTYVPAGKQCVSICTVAFLGGTPRRRFVHPTAQYVVHAFGNREWSRDNADTVYQAMIAAQEFVRCFDAGDSSGACEKAKPPAGLATNVIMSVAKSMNEKKLPVKPLSGVCNSKAVADIYREAAVAEGAELAGKSCAYQMAVTAAVLQSKALAFQKDAAQATRQLYQFLTSPPKGVHVERLLDRWFSVTLNNTVPLTRSEIANLGVAGILDLDGPSGAVPR